MSTDDIQLDLPTIPRLSTRRVHKIEVRVADNGYALTVDDVSGHYESVHTTMESLLQEISARIVQCRLGAPK